MSEADKKAPHDEVLVVLPTYNERQNLEKVVAGVRSLGHRVLIVDDSSPDGTGELADQLAAISADQARVVVLKDALDWSFEEISSRSGMPVGTAKCYAHRGRTSLRRRLAQTQA